jgi:hypothetical protein
MYAVGNGIPLSEEIEKEEPKVYEIKSVLTGNKELDSMVSDAIDEEDFCVMVTDGYTQLLYDYVIKNWDKLKSIGYELDDFTDIGFISITWDDDLAVRFMKEYKTEN